MANEFQRMKLCELKNYIKTLWMTNANGFFCYYRFGGSTDEKIDQSYMCSHLICKAFSPTRFEYFPW